MKTDTEHILQDCINKLRIVSGKRDKFVELEKKFRDRFNLSFLITVGEIENMEAGFDNHKNHQRPHIHIDNKYGRISIAIDNGKILHDRNTTKRMFEINL